MSGELSIMVCWIL